MLFYLAGGMTLFDSLCHTFGTAGTGGFSVKAASMGAYDAYAQTVTTVFMILFGVNFSIYFFLLRRKFDLIYKNTELRWYLIIIFSSIGLITVNVLPLFPSFREALHHSAFSVASIITTTGYCTADFNLWPEFSRVILVLLMLVGACAGSTGGGLKVSRAVILIRAAGMELGRLVHPRTVKVLQLDGNHSRNRFPGFHMCQRLHHDPEMHFSPRSMFPAISRMRGMPQDSKNRVPDLCS